MKFFIPISSFVSARWVALCDAPDTLVPSRQLCYPYSTLHNLLPRSGGPNSAFPKPETPAEDGVRCDLSTSSLTYLHSTMVDTQREGEHGLYSLRLSISVHSRCRISAKLYRDSVAGHRPSIRGNGTSLPIPNARLTNLLYENHVDILPYSKGKKFIQSKVAAINCGDLTYC